MAYTTIDKPTDYFETLLYTGTGSSNTITGLDFAPNWVWIKPRNDARGHSLIDSVRGVSKWVGSNENLAELTVAQGVTSFNSNGFTVGTSNDFNKASNTHVAWNWKAGGSASSNSDGSITSSVSASTTAGFSIVSYTGTGSNATVGHGLGAVPKMIFFKDRETSVDWGVYAEPIGNTKEMYLSTTDAAATNSGAFNNTTPTSSVFTIGTSSRYNPSSKGVIAYCFADVKGYLKIGSYTGNGNADGAFVYTGFRPAWVVLKGTASNREWLLHDNKRDPENTVDKILFPNTNDSESSGTDRIDILSNGFKLRNTGANWDQSGETFIFMAFAESPFVTSGGIPTTAR